MELTRNHLQNRLNELRNQEMIKISRILIGFIGIPIVLQSILTDLRVHGYDSIWLGLRLAIVPLGILAILLYRIDFFGRRPGIPVLLFAWYIGGIHCFFVTESGYEASPYFHGYVQLLMGLTLLPFSWRDFVLGTLLVLFPFVGVILVHNGGDFSVFSGDNLVFLKTYVILSYCVFFVTYRIRSALYRKTVDLEGEVKIRDQVIFEQVEKIARAKELELEHKKLREMERLSAQVSHDIRSPLSALKSVVRQIDAAPRLMEALRIATNRIDGIARDLSHRREVRKPKLEIANYQIKDILDELIVEKSAEHGRRIFLKIDEDAKNAMALVDKREFSRVVSNLLNNAIEATTPDQKVTLSLLGTENDQVKIVIRDKGKGIGKEILSRVFEEGFTWGKTKGSGRGLSHAQAIIEKHGGKLEIASQLGKGTNVTLLVPMGSEEKQIRTSLNKGA